MTNNQHQLICIKNKRQFINDHKIKLYLDCKNQSCGVKFFVFVDLIKKRAIVNCNKNNSNQCHLSLHNANHQPYSENSNRYSVDNFKIRKIKSHYKQVFFNFIDFNFDLY